MPAALNAANEIAVSAFLDGKISFSDIAEIDRSVFSMHESRPADEVKTILDADGAVRRSATELVAKLSRTAAAA